jgi:cytochrome c biogenesis protein CcmG, thiol:disulfide interchange protein DsbE
VALPEQNPISLGAVPPPTGQKKGLPRWVVLAAFIILLAFLALIGWGLRRTQEGPITIGQSVPPFILTTFDGQKINTADLKGRVIVINFWASWCGPCEQEAVDMEQAWQDHKSGGQVVFLGVDYVDTEPQALAYLKKFKITYPNGPDLRTAISQLFRIRGVPETYIIARDGRLAGIKIGPFSSKAEIQAAIEPLLK